MRLRDGREGEGDICQEKHRYLQAERITKRERERGRPGVSAYGTNVLSSIDAECSVQQKCSYVLLTI